jgi:CelD/BcsL family acetyltransferase involved in cellulose biosynthesis
MPVRVLGFLAVPDTQFTDLVASRSDGPALGAALAAYLNDRRNDWDLLRLNYISDQHPNWRSLAPALRSLGIDTHVEPAGVNPYIDLTTSFDAYYDTRTRKLKKGVNLSANRLARAGSVTVDWVREAPCDAALAEAIRISALSWKQRTGNSLDQPGPRAFIERLTAHAVRQGELSLWLLRVDGRAVATEYQLIADGNVYALRADFDPAYADASPGTFLSHHILTRLFGAGLRRYYLGPGANAYKLRWTDTAEPMYQLTAFSPTLRGRLLQWIERSARPQARRWRDRLRSLRRGPTQGDAA